MMTIAEMLLKKGKSEKNYDETDPTEFFVKRFKEMIIMHTDVFNSFNHGDKIATAESYDNGQNFNTHFVKPFNGALLIDFGPLNKDYLYSLFEEEGINVTFNFINKYHCITFFLI